VNWPIIADEVGCDALSYRLDVWLYTRLVF